MPISANSACTCSSVALNDRFPTYNFFTAVLLVPASAGHISETEEYNPCPYPGCKKPLSHRPARMSPGTHEHLAATTPRSQQRRRPKGRQSDRGMVRARSRLFCPVLKSGQAESRHRWYDAPKRCGDFHARNNDGLSTHARAYSRACWEALRTGGNRFASARPNNRAHELWRYLLARPTLGSRVGTSRTCARRPRRHADVESFVASRSILRHTSFRWRAPYPESSAACQ